MKKVIAMLLAIALTAAISIGATLAYLTDTDEDVNVMTLGNVKIDQLEYERIDDETADDDALVQEFHDNKPLYPAVTDKDFDYTPGDSFVDWEQIGKKDYTSDIWNPEKINNELDKMVFVKNKGKSDAFVRTIFAFEAGKYTTLDEFKSMMHLNLNETDWTWDWEETPVSIGGGTYFIATATYNKVLAPDAFTEISLSQIALDSSATNADVEAFGETYNVLVKSQAIQADGFDTAATALDEGFGPITVGTVPFTTDEPVQGTDIRTALYYLNGTPTGTKITSKVTNVVYGLNKDHPNVTENYDGVLVTNEQDVETYVYYVPNGNYYDIYFLANSKINMPKNCKELFYPLSQLQTVDTSNMSTSKVEDMTDMFYNCKKLKSIDVSQWDTSNVNSLFGTFCNCYVLESLDVSNWDTSKVTNLRAVFSNCQSITSLDVSNWDTSKVTTMRNMFNKCSALEEIEGVGNLKTDNVTDMCQMFAYCNVLKALDGIGQWNTGNVTDMSFMFRACRKLYELDVANWNTAKVTTFSSMFEYFPGTELHVENWDVSSCTRTAYMFIYNYNLKELDLSKWEVSNVKEFNNMFESCTSLKTLNLSGWKVEKAVEYTGMFHNCYVLEELDLSGFNNHTAPRMVHMFSNAKMLHTIYVSESWGVNHHQTVATADMFTGCNALVGGNGTSYAAMKSNDGTYGHADREGLPGYLTLKN